MNNRNLEYHHPKHVNRGAHEHSAETPRNNGECTCEHGQCSCPEKSADCENKERSEEELQDAPAQNESAELIKKLDEATAAAAKNKDLYIRAVADLENYRRKVQREKEDLAKFAIAPLVESLIPSLDTLTMAIDGLKNNDATKNYAEGLVMVERQVKKVLESFGVKEVYPMGEDFDPNLEECVSHEPSQDVPDGKVISVMRSGYTLNGRLLRPATVVVSKGKI